MNKKIIVALTVIILLGTVLRLYNLTEESLWTDEIISLNHAQEQTAQGIIDSVVAIELTPPGYYFLLSGWINISSGSEFSLRFLPAVFDILVIILIYIVGKKLANARIGLLSALIYATSMLPIVYAQEARHYSMFGFLALLSSLLLIYAAQGKKMPLALYVMTSAIALSLSYTGVFVLLFQGIFIFFYGSTILFRRYMWSVLWIGLLFVPFLPIAIKESVLRHAALQQALFLRGVPQVLSQFGMFFYVLPLVLLGIILAVLLYVVKKRGLSPEFRARALLYLMLGWAIMHIIFLEHTLRSFALIRHPFFIVPFIYIGFAYGIDNIKPKKIGAVALSVLLLFNGVTLAVYYTTTTKAPWREAISSLELNSGTDDLILFDRAGANIDLYNYYAKKASRTIPLTTWYNNGTFIEMDTAAVQELLKGEKSFWFISSRDFRTEDKYQKFLDENYKRVETREYKELKVIRYNNK